MDGEALHPALEYTAVCAKVVLFIGSTPETWRTKLMSPAVDATSSLAPDFAAPIAVDWQPTSNRRLGTFHVVGFRVGTTLDR